MTPSSDKVAPRCSGTTKGGKPCRRRALPGTDPPRCAINHGETGRPANPPPSEALIDELAELLGDGNYIETACERAGINKARYYEWLARGAAENDGPYARFANRMRVALAQAEADAIKTIKDAAGKDWKAAAWLLERTRPDKYARPETRKVADPPPPAQPRGAQAAAEEDEPARSPFDELDAVTDLSVVREQKAAHD